VPLSISKKSAVLAALPTGSMPVGGGLVINGLTTYGFLTVAKNALGDSAYDPLAALWGLVFIFGAGVFQPLEQEVARATAQRATQGAGSAPVLRKAAEIGAGFLAVVCAGVAIAWPLGLDNILDHNEVLLVSLMLALCSFWLAFPLRGLLAGRGEFGRYGLYFGSEGGTRFVFAVVLAIIAAGVGPYGIAIGVAPAVGIGLATLGKRPLARPGPPASLAEVSESLGWLLAASVFTNTLLNAGPVVVKALSDTEGEAGRFLDGLIIARVPLFFYQAVQASLLPLLSSLVGQQRHDEFRRVLLRLVSVVAAISVFGVVFSAVVGPTIVEIVFGDEISGRDMALMAGASGAFMMAMTFGQALIALHRLRRVVLGWFIGVVVFALVVMLGGDPFVRVALGLLAGASAAAVAMVILLPRQYLWANRTPAVS
jgi:O-antigen/teichoic acid export membrane protein